MSTISKKSRKSKKPWKPGLTLLAMAASLAMLTSCTIEPPLHLPGEAKDIVIDMPIVITELEVMWEVDAEWKKHWYYGWDDTDERLWGKIEYPRPTNFEVRRFYLGDTPGGAFTAHDAFTIYGNTFRRKYDFGYHDLLIWSNIDSPDGTQTVIVNESDLSNIYATTSTTRLGYSSQPQRTRAVSTHNQPEIFYSTRVRDLYISPNKEDYDYYDDKLNVWVKCIKPELVPMVYIYLVQVVLHKNNGRIIGVADQSSVNGMADGVSLHTGETSQTDANVTFDMRLKKGIDVEGETCDIIGGKLTTYGLCGMRPWTRQRSGGEVTRFDLDNSMALCLTARSGKSFVVTRDMTEEIRKHPHGGVLTVHIDVDELALSLNTGETGNPNNPGGLFGPSDSGFAPTVTDYGHEEYEFNI